MRNSVHKSPWIGYDASNSGSRSRKRTCKERPCSRALAAFKIAVAGRNTVFPGRYLVIIHGKAGRASRLTDFTMIFSGVEERDDKAGGAVSADGIGQGGRQGDGSDAVVCRDIENPPCAGAVCDLQGRGLRVGAQHGEVRLLDAVVVEPDAVGRNRNARDAELLLGHARECTEIRADDGRDRRADQYGKARMDGVCSALHLRDEFFVAAEDGVHIAEPRGEYGGAT